MHSETVVRSNQDLEEKVNLLFHSNQEMQQKLDTLTRLIERQGARNLMELQSVTQGSDTTDLETFRPSLDMVQNPTTAARHLDNYTISDRARSGCRFARRERLLRNIMNVDKVSWDEAHDQLIEMDKTNEEFYWLYSFPYRFGIIMAVGGAAGAVLMVFHGDVALWYAETVVGEGLPEGTESVKDMSVNQIGSWTWTWMEPMIGVGSFVLLCLQFSRLLTLKLNMNPYTETMMVFRGTRLANNYPRYDPAIVRSWAICMPQVDWKFMPRYRREMYTPENRLQNFRNRQK